MPVVRALKPLFEALLSRVPFPLTRALARAPVFFPYYHLVSDERVPHFAHFCERYPSVARFEADLDFFLSRFTPIDLGQLVRHLRDGAPLPRDPFFLSFDDGYRECHDVAFPILARKGVPATFFVNTLSLDNRAMVFFNKLSLVAERLRARGEAEAEVRAEIDGIGFLREAEIDRRAAELGLDFAEYLRTERPYLTSEQVDAMLAKGFTVGAHSLTHVPYALVGLDEQVRQTVECLRALDERFGLRHRAFAFPGNDDGVATEFFRRIAGQVDVSFGTTGGVEDPIPTHFQRTTFEQSRAPAASVLATRYGVEAVKRLVGRGVKRRPDRAVAR